MRKIFKVLFIGESATLAHIARPFELARNLDPKLYEVHFAADNYYSFVFENSKLNLHPIYSRSPKEFDQILKNKGVLFDAAVIEHYVKDELQLLAEVRPDVVVGDLRPSLAISAPTMGIPYLCLTNSYWSPYSDMSNCPIPFSGFLKTFKNSDFLANWIIKKGSQVFQKLLPKILADQAEGVDTVRKKLGLEPFKDYLTGFTWGDTTLYCDPVELNSLKDLPHSHRYLGPVCWSPSDELPDWWSQLPTDRPIVYLSLGSSGDVSLLEILAKALVQLPVTVVVATAGRRLLNSLPSSFYVADFLPGNQVVKRAAVVITNGGSPSSYQALEAGVPILGMPINMDQFLCMEKISKHGSGILIRSDLATPRKIKTAVRSLLENSKFKERAQSIKNECQNSQADINFSKILQEWNLNLEQENLNRNAAN